MEQEKQQAQIDVDTYIEELIKTGNIAALNKTEQKYQQPLK